MTLDAKQSVLCAIYAEYQKDLPEMNKISASALGMDLAIFNVAIDKLQNEGLIQGAVPIDTDHFYRPVRFLMECVMMTNSGIQYAEELQSKM